MLRTSLGSLTSVPSLADQANQTGQTDNWHKAKDKAIQYLATREHSRYELEQKLRGWADHVDIHALLDELESLGLQSNQRFTEALIRSKVSSGYGPNRILRWLRQHNIPTRNINDALQARNIDWFAVAQRQSKKHFGTNQCVDTRTKVRQIRYLYNRGFNQDQISYVTSRV